MIRMRAPAGSSSISVGGNQVNVAEDGSVEVSEALAADLAGHGFRPWDGPAVDPLPPIEEMTRLQLEAAVVEVALEEISKQTDDKIREALIARRDAVKRDAEQRLSAEDIDALSYNELKKLLKAKAVALPSSITADALREIARNELGEEGGSDLTPAERDGADKKTD